MKMRPLTIILFLLLFSVTGIAQVSDKQAVDGNAGKEEKQATVLFKGQVISSEDNFPVPYASLKVSVPPNTQNTLKALVTDADGKFEVKLPPIKGMYIFAISSVGYKPIMKGSPLKGGEQVVDLGEIKLEVDAIQLSTVTVKPLVVATSSEITYNLDQDPDRETSTMHQIIDKVPMIERLPNGDIYVGEPGSSFIFVRNGKIDALFNDKEALTEVLKSLPAKAFASVTVKLMPESRYGNARYVVSVQADEVNRLYGVVNPSGISYDFGSGTLGLVTELLSSFDRLRLSAKGNFSNTNSPSTKTTLHQEMPADNYTLTQGGKSGTTGESYGGNLHFSYDLAKQHFITGRISYSNARSRTNKDLSTSILNANEETAYTIRTKEKNLRESISGGINYQYDFANPKRVLNVLYDVSHAPNTPSSDILGEGEGADAFLTPELRGSEKDDQHTVQVHYSDPLVSNFDLETGLTYRYRNLDTRSNYLNQSGGLMPELETGMKSTKHTYSHYINLNYRSKIWSGKLRLVSEYLEDGEGTRIISAGKEPQFISESGFRFMPEAQVSLMFPKQFINRMGLSYRLTKRRPQIHMMTTNIDYSNPNYLSVGNPNLDSEDIHTAMFSFSTKMNLNFGINGSYSGNRILNYWYTDEENRLVKTFSNYGSYKAIGVSGGYSLIFPTKVEKMNVLLIRVSNIYSVMETADHQETKTNSVSASITPMIALSKAISIDFSLNYMKDFSKGSQSYDYNPLLVSAGVKFKLLNERLTTSITLTSVNFREKFEQTVDTEDFFMRQTTRINRIPIMIGLNWRLGDFKVKEVRKARRGAIQEEMSTGGRD